METIELTIDAPLLAELDRVTRELALSRSDFTRFALQLALRNQHTLALEQQHAMGYMRKPAARDDHSEWEPEQIW